MGRVMFGRLGSTQDSLGLRGKLSGSLKQVITFRRYASRPDLCVCAGLSRGFGIIALVVLVVLAVTIQAGSVAAQTASGLRGAVDPDQTENEDPPATNSGPGNLSNRRRSNDTSARDRTTRDGPARTGSNTNDSTPPAVDRTAPNYDRPRRLPDKRLAYPGRRRSLRGSLAPVVPYATAPANERERATAGRQPPVQYARPPVIERKERPRQEVNPYAPLGINLGSIRVLPFVELSVGYDTNSDRSPTAPQGSGFGLFEAGFTAISLWSRHEFRADVKGSYYRFFTDKNASRPEGSAKFNLRLDATRTVRLDFELRGTLATQRPGSPELNASVVGRPVIATVGATAGVTKTIGRVEASLTGLVDRTIYANARLTNGNTLRLSRDNYNAFGLRGRLAYEVTPGLRPFVEVSADMRRRDEAVDSGGFARNSNGLAAKLGTTFELSRILTGEVSAGYVRRTYSDPRLATIAGMTVDASLIWTATPLTTVTFRAQTDVNETTIANASGSISRRGSIEINHALLRNFNLGATAMWQNTKYRGVALTENTLEGTLKAEYSLTRSVVVKGSFTHSRLQSSTAGADYTANVFLLGLRLQR